MRRGIPVTKLIELREKQQRMRTEQQGVRLATLAAIKKGHEELRRFFPELWSKPCECYYCKLAK